MDDCIPYAYFNGLKKKISLHNVVPAKSTHDMHVTNCTMTYFMPTTAKKN